MGVNEIDRLIQVLSKLPGLGPRSARRVALYLIKNTETILKPLALVMETVADKIQTCSICGNVDSINPCSICTNAKRDGSIICVVEDVADLWALERSAIYNGTYHVLGGVLSPLDGIGPDDLTLDGLFSRVELKDVVEVILATGATVDGKTTAHYIAERMVNFSVNVTALAHGIPVGGELDYLDDGTLSAALKARSGV
jgi:recombination protein RecR